jgi:hypothetical protein
MPVLRRPVEPAGVKQKLASVTSTSASDDPERTCVGEDAGFTLYGGPLTD